MERPLVKPFLSLPLFGNPKNGSFNVSFPAVFAASCSLFKGSARGVQPSEGDSVAAGGMGLFLCFQGSGSGARNGSPVLGLVVRCGRAVISRLMVLDVHAVFKQRAPVQLGS